MKARFPPTVYARVTSAPPGSGAAIVLTGAQHWNKKLQKKFTHPKKLHISDPSHSLRTGDTVAIARWPSLSRSKLIQHTVTQIIAPWGRDGAAPLSSRPPVWTEEQRRAWRHERLLVRGTINTQRGLRTGALFIGEEGKIMARTAEEVARWRAENGLGGAAKTDRGSSASDDLKDTQEGLREMKESETT